MEEFMRYFKHLLAVCFAGMIFVSCRSAPTQTPKVCDDSLDEAKTAVLYFHSLVPVSYNGIPVDASMVRRPRLDSYTALIRFPAGRATMVCDIHSMIPSANGFGGMNYTTIEGTGYSFSYTFEAGEEYYVIFSKREEKPGVLIYKTKLKSLGWPPDESLEAFVPLQASQAQQRTILQ
jgi:hypothetical protein